MRERIMLNLARSLERLSVAVKSLGRVKDGKTLFEHSPSKDAEAYSAWTELDAAQKDAAVKLSGYRIAALASSEGPARQCSHRKQMDKTSGHWMQCGLDEGHSGDHDYCWLRTEPAPTFEEPLRERITQLEKALDSAIGWIGYGEDCDPYYFSHDQAPEFEKEFAEIKAVRAGAEKLAGE